jgi:hypothetical protein
MLFVWPSGRLNMPLNEIPSYLGPETRRLIDLALDEAWQELKNDLPADPLLARRKMAGDNCCPNLGRRDGSCET